MKEFLHYFFCCTAVCVLSWLSISKVEAQAIPSIDHYSIYDYQAHAQNWSVVQDDLGRVFVGNTKGILTYDGNTWNLIPLPNLSAVRALKKTKDNKIYVGAVGDLGYLDTDSIGNKIYISLLDKLPKEAQNFSTIWKIFDTSRGIVFQSFEKIFIWNQESFKVINPTSQAFHLAFQVDDDIWVREWGKGFYKVTPQGLNLIPKSEVFADEKVYAVLPYQKNVMVVVTEQQGLFTYDSQKGFEKLACSDELLLRASQVYCGIRLSDGRYAIGTRQRGVLVFDPNFNLLFALSSENGLKDDAVAALYEDSNKQLWTALSNGIAYIDIASAFYYYNQTTGLAENVLSISPFYEGNVFVGTIKGVFKSDSLLHSFDLLKNSEQETHQIDLFSNTLLAAQSIGVKKLTSSTIEKVGEPSRAVYDFLSLRSKPTFLIGVAADSLLLFEKSELENAKTEWKFVTKLKGFGAAVTQIAEDKEGRIWVSDYNKGVFRLKLSEDLKNITHADFFGKLNGLPKNQGNHVFSFNGDVVFGTLEGLYAFENGSFVPHPLLADLVDKKPVTVLEQDNTGTVWVVTENEKNPFKPSQTLLVKLERQANGTYQRYDAPFRKIKQVVQAVRPINDKLVFIGTNEGLIMYHASNTIADAQSFEVFITKVSYVGSQDSLLLATDKILSLESQSPKGIIELPYQLNTLRFSFGSSFFEERSSVYYQTKLEPLEENWSAWTTETEERYTNLPNGVYTLKVKAKNLYGYETNVRTFTFRIETPWFRHWLFYFFVAACILATVFFSVQFYTRRMKVEKFRLEKEVRKRTEEMRQAYFNTKILSKIGQKITSTRSIDEISQLIYENISRLMDASVFAIGIHNEENETIDFPSAIENGKMLPFHSENLADTGRFAVWCFLNEQDLFINDSETDFDRYVPSRPPTLVGEPAPSLIYLPLKIKDNVIGVLTVQSFQKNAYNDYHLNLLRSLAVYVAIAIENANSYHQINEQKVIIEDKNKQLISSINYAKRIQNAILPPLESIQEAFEDSFVLFLPRDIVSGDFYYFTKQDHKLVLSAIDCTGHGVPGAFMSMIGYELLNEIILVKQLTEPHKILDALHEGISSSLRQEQTSTQDGMDMTLCTYDTQTGLLEVAAARNPMYLFNTHDKTRKLEIEADRQSIGGKMNDNFEFTNHQIPIQKGDTIYLLSDGFQDQFGGKDNKKYLRRRLRELLESFQHLTLSQQRRVLQREFVEWRGEHEQVDDILIIGVRF